MKVKEIMERAGINQTGRAIAYIKDGLEEIELFTKQNVVRGSIASATGTGISFDTTIASSYTISMAAFTQTDAFGDTLINVTEESSPITESISDGDMKYRTTTDAYASNDGVAALACKMTGGSGGIGAGKVWFPATNIGDQTTTIAGNTWYYAKIKYYNNTAVNAKLSVANPSDNSNAVSATINTSNSNNTSGQLVSAGESAAERTNIIAFKTNSGVTSIKIGLEFTSFVNDQVFYINTIELWNATIHIKDSNSSFSAFTSDMKILVNGSSTMDTDKSSSASSGYYTINSASSNDLTLDYNEGFLRETSGESITVRGQTLNYMDIIKDKRFYPLPDDMLKLMDVKIKNHKNGNDKYKSVERAIYAPSEQDGDNI